LADFGRLGEKLAKNNLGVFAAIGCYAGSHMDNDRHPVLVRCLEDLSQLRYAVGFPQIDIGIGKVELDSLEAPSLALAPSPPGGTEC
jgi:hypothetical protein